MYYEIYEEIMKLIFQLNTAIIEKFILKTYMLRLFIFSVVIKQVSFCNPKGFLMIESVPDVDRIK